MTDDDLTLEVQAVLQRLARQIARQRLDLEDLANESGLGFSSVESGDGTLDLIDDNGNTRVTIGFQSDDRFAIKHANGDAPPQPESPDCVAVDGGILVLYDGTFVDDDPPSDLAYYEVHASDTSGYTADDTTLVGVIQSEDGGSFVYGTVDTDIEAYISIVAVNMSSVRSPKSDETLGRSGGLLGTQKLHVASSPTDLVFTLPFRPVRNSTVHLYWNELPQEDDTWSVDDFTFTVLDPGGIADTGDRFWVKYLRRDSTAAPPPEFTLVGTTVSFAHTITDIALPAGTVAGDRIGLVAGQGFFGGATDVTCTDSRMTVVESVQVDGGAFHRHAIAAWGVADSSGANVTVHCADPTGDNIVWLVVYRQTSGGAGAGVGSHRGFAAGGADDANCVPAMPGSGDAGLMINLVYDSALGANPHDAAGNWIQDAVSGVSGPAKWSAAVFSSDSGVPSAHIVRSDNAEYGTWITAVLPLD